MMVATSAQTSAVWEVRTIRLFTSEYALDNFPYDTALEIFLAQKNRRGVGLTGGQRGNVGVTGALDLDLLAQAIRDNE
jgi:hypothetical protein